MSTGISFVTACKSKRIIRKMRRVGNQQRRARLKQKVEKRKGKKGGKRIIAKTRRKIRPMRSRGALMLQRRSNAMGRGRIWKKKLYHQICLRKTIPI